MSTAPDPQLPSLQMAQERLDALPPEEKRRILTAMQFLVDLKALHLDGLRIGSDLLEGKVPTADLGERLMDFERSLRLAANDMLKRPMRVTHAEALRKGETKLDEEPWLMRTRIRASEARKAREEKAREERFRASMTHSTRETAEAESDDEPDAGPRP